MFCKWWDTVMCTGGSEAQHIYDLPPHHLSASQTSSLQPLPYSLVPWATSALHPLVLIPPGVPSVQMQATASQSSLLRCQCPRWQESTGGDTTWVRDQVYVFQGKLVQRGNILEEGGKWVCHKKQRRWMQVQVGPGPYSKCKTVSLTRSHTVLFIEWSGKSGKYWFPLCPPPRPVQLVWGGTPRHLSLRRLRDCRSTQAISMNRLGAAGILCTWTWTLSAGSFSILTPALCSGPFLALVTQKTDTGKIEAD